jgi:hypothetical protein
MAQTSDSIGTVDHAAGAGPTDEPRFMRPEQLMAAFHNSSLEV